MAAPAMDDIADRYADRGVTSVFAYTREAHPGERYRHHTSMEGKRANAAAFVEHSSARRPILLDDLDGTAHRGFGMLPNMTWIIGRGGIVYYKAEWTDAADVERVLVETLDAMDRRKDGSIAPFYREQLAWRGRDDAGFRAGLERTGPQAVDDFYR